LVEKEERAVEATAVATVGLVMALMMVVLVMTAVMAIAAVAVVLARVTLHPQATRMAEATRILMRRATAGATAPAEVAATCPNGEW
jgi:hypothetical protein